MTLSTGSKYIVKEKYSNTNSIEDCLHSIIDYYIKNGIEKDSKINVPN